MAEGRARRSLLADTRPLRESPAFRRLWIGTMVSYLGSTMTSFALVLQTYDLTHSSVAVGAIGLAFPAAAQMSSPASSEVHTTTRVRSPRNRSRANSSGSPDRA